MPAERESWKSTLGFVLAAVGSAVGLGNLWRFAYLASEGGGAAFVLAYLAIVAVVGVPLLTAELVVGRRTQASALRAPAVVAGPPWRWLGVVFVVAGFGILAYYSVIMGWTAQLLVDTLRGAIPEDTAAHFAVTSAGGRAVVFHLIGMALTIAIVAGGVRGGIERASLVLMPTLFLLVLGLAIWAGTLSGAGAGYTFYLRPELGELAHFGTLSRAAGQAFFSLSLGMGAIMTYASYLRGAGNLPREAGTIAISDTAVAFVGGLVTFPVVSHFGLQGAVGESTVGALFIALPRAFHAMGAAGVVVGVLFFVALYIAALTSAISLLEVVTAGLIDAVGWPRRAAALAAGSAIAAAGVPVALDTRWVGLLDQLVGNMLLIFGGLMTAILVGYVWREADEELARGFPYPAARRVWRWLLRVALPAILLIVLYGGVRTTVEMVRGLLAGG